MRDIAIIGMAGRFPGAKNIDEYWENLKQGRESVRFFSEQELLNAGIPEEMLKSPDYVKAAPILENIDLFDAEFFGFSRREAEFLDPQQRLLLECAWKAFEHAGYDPDRVDGSVGVFAGSGGVVTNYLLNCLESYPEMRGATASFQHLGNDKDFLATRISYKLNLRGPSIVVQSACSTSLVAIHMACQSVLNGECDMALAGGVNVRIPQFAGYVKDEGGVFSDDGHCRAFDEKATGIVFGSGMGLVLIKLLDDAVRDQDNILAVIKGSVVNNDGGVKLSYAASSGPGQVRCISEAFALADVSPETLQYVECHGTGTAMGDPVEIGALSQVFRKFTKENQFCAVGSVKTNFGHLDVAAGVASLIKTVLCLQHREIPPIVNFNKANPRIDFKNSPFYVNTALNPWTSKGGARRAAVNGLGIGGTNAFIILEEAPPVQPVEAKVSARPKHLLVISGKTRAALTELAQSYRQHLTQNSKMTIEDLCYSAALCRSHFKERLALVAATPEQLQEKLTLFCNGEPGPGIVTAQARTDDAHTVAFLFAGQGSQYFNMGKQLYDHHPAYRAAIERCEAVLRPYLDKPLSQVLFDPREQTTLVNEPLYAQSALCAVEYAVAQLWLSWGVRPTSLLGHSMGEYIAACIAGVFSLEDAFKLIVRRAQLVQTKTAPGEMGAIAASEADVAKEIMEYRDTVSIAVLNGPESSVISGKRETVRKVLDIFAARGVQVKLLQIGWASHSPLVDPILDEFEAVAREITYHKPNIPIISNVSGQRVDMEMSEAGYWRRHLRHSVRFTDGIATLFAEGCRHFIEMAPGTTLVGIGKAQLPEGMSASWLPTLKKDREDWDQLLESLGEMYTQGYKVDWKKFATSTHKRIPLPAYPFQKQRYWIEGQKGLAREMPAREGMPAFLGNRLESSERAGEVVFYGSLAPDRTESVGAFLLDHQVFGEIVVPGAAYVDMALSAVSAATATTGSAAYGLEGIEILAPMILRSGEIRDVQLVLAKENNNFAFRILSKAAGGEAGAAWQVHARGRAVLQEERLAQLPSSSDLAELRGRLTQEVAREALYDFTRTLGVEYGPHFQGVQKIWQDSTQQDFLALIKFDPELKRKGIKLHPALLDACFQVTLAPLLISGDGPKPFLPVSIESVTFIETPLVDVWCHVHFAMPAEVGGKTTRADLRLMDESGKILVEIRDFVAVVASQTTLFSEAARKPSRIPLASWFYQVNWPEVARVTSVQKDAQGPWLIVTGQDHTAEEFAKVCKARNIEATFIVADNLNSSPGTFSFNAGDPQDYSRALNAASALVAGREFSRVVSFLALDAEMPGSFASSKLQAPSADFSQLHKISYGRTICLIQALLEQKTFANTPLSVVTRGAQAASGKCGPGVLAQSPVWGLARVARAEAPQLRLQTIDLDGGANAEALFEEILHFTAEDQVALHGQARRVARLQRQPMQALAGDMQFAADTSHLITGGLSGLGLGLVGWMIARGAKNFVLAGRRDPSDETLKTIAAYMRAGATICVVRADVAKEEDVIKIMRSLKAMPRLSSVIHAAGVLHDTSLAKQNWQAYADVMASKVNGAWNLHRHTLEVPLDRFVMFSSVASVVGTPGQANYAAANIFLDEFANYRRSLGLPALSLGWGPWAEIGLAAKLEKSHIQQLEQGGLQFITKDQGFAAFAEACARAEQNSAPGIVVAPIWWDKFYHEKLLAREVAFFANVIDRGQVTPTKPALVKTPVVSAVGGGLWDKIAGLAEAEKRVQTQVQVEKLLREVLALDAKTELDPRRSLSSYGMDSLLAVEFRRRVRKSLGEEFGKAVNATLVFNYPTIEALTEFLTKSVLLPRQRSSEPAPAQAMAKKPALAKKGESIAIVGMGCRFPGGANDLAAYWKLLAEGVCGISEVPKSRWDINKYYSANPDDPGKGNVRSAGFLKDLSIQHFDADFFEFSPREARATDPQLRLLLEVAWEAIENAGESADKLYGSKTGIFVGSTWNDYLEVVKKSGDAEELELYLGWLASSSTISGRLAYFLGVHGPTMQLDTACSSSLVATHLACQSLLLGECDRALAGGVNALLSPSLFNYIAKMHLLSPTGKSYSFDSRANGFVRAEGCGVVVLKRLSDAVAAKDQIFAVIKGSSVGHGGRAASPAAPNGQAQEVLIRQALANAGVTPAEVGYLEAHATATILGDPIEVAAAGNVLSQGRGVDRPLYLGSVKGNLGHCEGASGMAGLIKIVLAMQHKQIPAQVNFATLNPHINLQQIPAVIPLQLTAWPALDGKRLAGISSFGLSGVIAHAVIEEAPPVKTAAKPGEVERAQQILTLSARSEAALQGIARKYEGYFVDHPRANMGDVCYTAGTGRAHFAHRLAIVGSSASDMQKKLQAFLIGTTGCGVATGKAPVGGALKTALLFSGQGSQYLGMGRQLYETQPEFRRQLDGCAKEVDKYLKEPLLKVMFEKEELLNQTQYTQPALFALEYSLFQLWKSWGLAPQAVMGHSIGEVVAACAAGVFSREDGLKLIAHRGRLMQELPGRGGMSVVSADEARVQKIIDQYGLDISIAAINGPESTTVSGKLKELEILTEHLKREGLRVKALKVSHAFHSSQMDAMLAEFEAVAKQIVFNEPKIKIYSNLSGRELRREEACDPAYWRRHIREPVRFADAVLAIWESGIRHFMEIGPGSSLVGMGQFCVAKKEEQGVWLACLKKDREDWEQILECTGALYTRGFNLDWSGFEKDTPERHKLALPTYAFQRKTYWPAQSESAEENVSVATAVPKAKCSLLEDLKSAPAGRFEDILTRFVLSSTKKVFGLDASTGLTPEQEFGGLGMDSLLAMELRNELIAGLGRQWNLPPGLLFEFPTVAGLVQNLGARIRDNMAQLAPTQPHAEAVIHAVQATGSRWIRSRKTSSEVDSRLFCFHYAGGAAQIFDPWFDGFPANIELCPVQLPGRWERANELPVTNMNRLIAMLGEGLSGKLDKPYAVFGYSFGALVAHCWMRELRRQGKPLPYYFFPSASRPPQSMGMDTRALASDDVGNKELLEGFQKIFGGIPKELLNSTELQDMFVPTLRSDMQTAQSLQYEVEAPFDFSIAAFGGRGDAWASQEIMMGWQQHTQRDFSFRQFQGDHFFMNNAKAELIEAIISIMLNPTGKGLLAV